MKIAVFTDPHRSYSEKTSRVHDKVFSSIDQSQIDLVVVAGDWGTASLDHVKKAFKAFRTAFPNKDIVGVLGNHDLWDKNKSYTISYKMMKINEYARNFNIHLLENNAFEYKDLLILGFNGWYFYSHPDTRDSQWMRAHENGKPVDNYLNDMADKALNYMIDYPKEGKKVISVTHFPCLDVAMDNPFWNGNLKHGNELLEFSDLIIFGHTHHAVDLMVEGVRVLNVGNDYNKLIYQIVEI